MSSENNKSSKKEIERWKIKLQKEKALKMFQKNLLKISYYDVILPLFIGNGLLGI